MKLSNFRFRVSGVPREILGLKALIPGLEIFLNKACSGAFLEGLSSEGASFGGGLGALPRKDFEKSALFPRIWVHSRASIWSTTGRVLAYWFEHSQNINVDKILGGYFDFWECLAPP